MSSANEAKKRNGDDEDYIRALIIRSATRPESESAMIAVMLLTTAIHRDGICFRTSARAEQGEQRTRRGNDDDRR